MAEKTMHPVTSSNIGAVGYDPATRELSVSFKNGKTYHYPDVPVEHFDGLRDPKRSAGSYFHQHIRSAFKARV